MTLSARPVLPAEILPPVCALDREVDLSHYLRQATILIRRHSATINYAYILRRHPAAAPSPWKP